MCLRKAEVQYSVDGQNNWKKAGDLTNAKDQTVNFTTSEKIKAIRIVNKEQTAGWVRVGEIRYPCVKECDNSNYI